MTRVVFVCIALHASVASAQFSALGAGAAWRFQITTDMLDGEDPAVSSIEFRVVEDRPEGRGRRVRWEWMSAGGAWTGGIPTSAIIDARGMRVDEPRSPVLPTSFARIRSRDAVNRTYVTTHDGLGCFRHHHQGRGEGEFYAWEICFDETGAPRSALSQGTGSEETISNPVVVSSAQAPRSPPADDTAISEWLLALGRSMVAAGTGGAPDARFNHAGPPNDDLRSTQREAPLGRGQAELLAVTILVNAIASDPGYVSASAIVLADGRLRWAGVDAGRGSTEPADADLPRELPEVSALVDRLASLARGSCELARLTPAEVPWATPELLRELAANEAALGRACTTARTLTGTILPRVFYVQAIVRSGGQIHMLKSYLDRSTEGRRWVRAARLEF